MSISMEDIKLLREQTSCGIIDCKKALEEASGDMDKAKELLKKRGLELAAKKGHRTANQGRVEAYIHMGNKIGVIVEVNCETDFVGRNEDFIKFCKDVAMHIAAMNPAYISKKDVPEDILKEQADRDMFCKERCLLEQAYVKDPGITIQDYLNTLIAKIGENIFIRRFIRYKVGTDD